MRIGTRILLGFGVVVALTIGMGLYALYKQAAVRRFTQQMDTRDFRVLDALRQVSQSEDQMRAMREMVLVQHLLQKEHLPGGNPDESERQWQASREQNLKLLGELEQATEAYETSAITSARAVQWREIKVAARRAQDTLKALTPEVESEFAAIDKGDLSGMLARMPSVERARVAYTSALADAQKAVEGQIATGRADIENYYDETRISVIVAIIATALAGILASIFIQRSIAAPLAGFIAFAERVGKGDLTEQAPVTRRDELGDLARSLNQMLLGLRDVAQQTRTVVENLNAATAEILASTQQQAASTAEQAAAVQQANATMAEISQSGAQISERARQVAAAAEATSSASSAGLQSVQNTNATMESIREQAEVVAENVIELSEKTQAVGEIIATVNDIAEQSHLLSLNAAIEAAAAGEQGRSFSVVAGEMKNLAEQSKQATVQVRSILGDIQKAINSSVMLTEEAVKRVESGRQQAEVADRTIRQLTGNIEQSVQAFQQIVAGSSQQQIGFEQVSQAFRSIGTA
ncbi:MAG: methyl-accepting chemotaxis protein, partial [Acidobacteria bacterium]|nr:methyl-accepting chemotaxis protein [Acidobacteriota bacterium]